MSLNNFTSVYEVEITFRSLLLPYTSSIMLGDRSYIPLKKIEDYLNRTTTFTLLFYTMQQRDELIQNLNPNISYSIRNSQSIKFDTSNDNGAFIND